MKKRFFCLGSPRRFAKDALVDHSLRHSVRDGMAYSAMHGSGESYFSAFAIFFKANAAQIGLLASLPPLLASFAQLLSAWLGRKVGARRHIILIGASLQAVMLLPMTWLPLLFPQYAFWIIALCTIVYFSGANLAAPQWSSLMGDLVPERRRGRFFALRNRLCSVTAFIALTLSGLLLHVFDQHGRTMIGFMVIFTIAAIARAVSVYHLGQMTDPPGHVAALELPGRSLLRRLRNSVFFRFSLFYALMQFAVAVASPFFVLYMLRDLHLSYVEYTVISASSVLMQVLALHRWGRLSDAYGNRIILVISGCMIPFLPLLWLGSTSFLYIVFIQLFGGLAWAGFSLSAGNFVYDLTPPPKRATYMAMHNVLASTGVFLGAMLGGYLGSILPNSMVLFGHSVSWASGLYGIFILSSILRLAVVVYFLPRIREVRSVKAMPFNRLVFRVSRFHPLSGLIFDIVGVKKRKTVEKLENT